MDQLSSITSTVMNCVTQLNRQLAVGDRLGISPDSIVMGDGGTLDSLGLITLFVNIEQELASKHGLSCPLLDTATSEENPDAMRTLGRLVEWITQNAKVGA